MKRYNLTDEERTKLCRLEARKHLQAYDLADLVSEVIMKFDGKVLNKRLETALKAIDRNIELHTPYNSFDVMYQTEDRSIKTSDGSWSYIDNPNCYIVGMCKASQDDNKALTNDNRIIAKNIIKDIQRKKEYNKQTYNETESRLSEVEFFKKRKENIVNQIEAHNNDIPYHIKQYFDLDIRR